MEFETNITRPLGTRVGEGADEGRQHHVEQREHRRQRRASARLGGARRAQQFDGGDQQRVVSQRAEELRRHDGVETFFHRVARAAGAGAGCAWFCGVSRRRGRRVIARGPGAIHEPVRPSLAPAERSPRPCPARSKP